MSDCYDYDIDDYDDDDDGFDGLCTHCFCWEDGGACCDCGAQGGSLSDYEYDDEDDDGL